LRTRGKNVGLPPLLPFVASDVMDGNGKVVRRDRLGGLLGFYYREAA
jgi:hypothetical protein